MKTWLLLFTSHLHVMLTRIQIWNPRSYICSDVRSTVAAAVAAAPGLVFNRDTNLIAVFACSMKGNPPAVDHEANRLVFMTVFDPWCHLKLFQIHTPPPM